MVVEAITQTGKSASVHILEGKQNSLREALCFQEQRILQAQARHIPEFVDALIIHAEIGDDGLHFHCGKMEIDYLPHHIVKWKGKIVFRTINGQIDEYHPGEWELYLAKYVENSGSRFNPIYTELEAKINSIHLRFSDYYDNSDTDSNPESH